MRAPDPARSEAEVPSTWPLTIRYVVVAPLPQVVMCTKRHPFSGVVYTVTAGGDVAVDGHGGDVAGSGDLGHGELAGVVRASGLVDQRGGHLGFAAAGADARPGARRPAWVRSLMRAASYSTMRANMPKTKLPWAVVVSTMPLVSDRTPTPRVCRVVTMSTRSRRLRSSRSIFHKIRVSPRRRSARHAFHCGRSALVPVAV